MRACEIKSTGFLVDELLTLDLKIAAGNTDAVARRHELGNVVIERSAKLVTVGDLTKYREFQRTTAELAVVLKDCWDAQDIIMSLPPAHECSVDQLYEMAVRAKEAQETNARRNRLVRRLDAIMDEMAWTQLAKTYDKGTE